MVWDGFFGWVVVVVVSESNLVLKYYSVFQKLAVSITRSASKVSLSTQIADF